MPSKINTGEVAIVLCGETRMLKPTLRAVTSLSNLYGGLAKARDSVVAQDINAAANVIRYGLNLSDRDARNLPDMVYETGLGAELLVPLIAYIGILANGGKPLPDAPDESGGADVDSGNA